MEAQPDARTVDLQNLLRLLEAQSFFGCGSAACEKRPCLTFQQRMSSKPKRGPSRLTARACALAVASLSNPVQYLCEDVAVLQSVAAGRPPKKIDTASFEQQLMTTATLRSLFEDDQTYTPVSSNSVSRTEALRISKTAGNLWPLPHPTTTARAILSMDPEEDPRAVRRALYPKGYEYPTVLYQANVIRAICMERMKRAIEYSDFHYDLLVWPPGYFLFHRFGTIPRTEFMERHLGIRSLPSDIGKAHPLWSLRLAALAKQDMLYSMSA